MAERQQELVLAPNEVMYTMDRTSGQVIAYRGPYKEALADAMQPANWDGIRFVEVETFEEAIKQCVKADEGQYVVLHNPTTGGAKVMTSGKNVATALDAGKTIVVRGPCEFPLWPGQEAEVINGHQLDEDQHLKIRVSGPVSEEDAAWLFPLVSEEWRCEDADEGPPQPAGSAPSPAQTGNAVGEQTGADGPPPAAKQPLVPQVPAPEPTMAEYFSLGTEFSVPGSRTSFFIPPTGIFVKPAGVQADGVPSKDAYVRRGVPITATQYVVLVNRVGVQSYVYGPTTVIPCIDQRFVLNPKTGTPVFEAEQINEHSGVVLRTLRALTVREVRSRIPNVHLLGVPQDGDRLSPGTQLVVWKREQLVFPVKDIEIVQRFSAVHIEAGSARYVKDLRSGTTKVLPGERLELLDPRVAEFVERPLTPAQIALWFPKGGYQRALVPCIEVPQGTAALVRVKSADGQTVKSRVLRGYQVVFLEWNEVLASIRVSGSRLGEAKNWKEAQEICFLWMQGNRVNDIANGLLSQDGCGFAVAYTLTVDFQDGEEEQWFAVDDYVYLVCEAVRSRLRGMMLRLPIHEIATNYVELVRDAILGVKAEGQSRPGLPFPRIGAKVVEIDVRDLTYKDPELQAQLATLQQASVEESIRTRTAEVTLGGERDRQQIEQERLATETALVCAKAEAAVAKQRAEEGKRQTLAQLASETAVAQVVADLVLTRQQVKADSERVELEHAVAVLKQHQKEELDRAAADLQQALSGIGAEIARLDADADRQRLLVENERARAIIEREVLRLEKQAAAQALVVSALGAQVGADLRMLAQTEMSTPVVEALGRAAAFEGVDTMEILARLGGKVPALAGLVAVGKEMLGGHGTNGGGDNGQGGKPAIPAFASAVAAKPAPVSPPRE